MRRWIPGLLFGLCLCAARGAVLVRDNPLSDEGGDEPAEFFVGFPSLSASNSVLPGLNAGGRQEMTQEDIIAQSRRLIGQQPDDPRPYSIIANLYLRENRLDEAAEYFWRAARLDPGSKYYVQSLGFALLSMGDHANGLQVYRKLEQADPNDPRLQFNIAAALHSLGNHKAAAEAMTSVLAVWPNNMRALYNMGLIQFGLGNTSDARARLEKCRELQPDNVFVICALMRVYEKSRLTAKLNQARDAALKLVDEKKMEAILSHPEIPLFLLR